MPSAEGNVEETLSRRKALLGGNLSVSYHQPLKIVRGWRQYLYDDAGRAYLDVYNNVPLVGHSHPRVVEAAQRQLALLNSNTRYLHENILRYAERLTALMPKPLEVCFVLNSGSEANELALRLAQATTRSDDVIVLEHAYHGHTNTLIDISPYKFDGPGGGGKKSWVHVAPLADDYRGLHRRGEAQLGAKYAQRVGQICDDLQKSSRRPTYIAETLPSVPNCFPPGILRRLTSVCAPRVACALPRVRWFDVGRILGISSPGVVPDIGARAN
jgi:4-aminobutyrate aminotransferase-like enzyme